MNKKIYITRHIDEKGFYSFHISETKNNFQVYNQVIPGRFKGSLIIIYDKFISFAVAFANAETMFSDYEIKRKYKEQMDSRRFWRDELGKVLINP